MMRTASCSFFARTFFRPAWSPPPPRENRFRGLASGLLFRKSAPHLRAVLPVSVRASDCTLALAVPDVSKDVADIRRRPVKVVCVGAGQEAQRGDTSWKRATPGKCVPCGAGPGGGRLLQPAAGGRWARPLERRAEMRVVSTASCAAPERQPMTSVRLSSSCWTWTFPADLGRAPLKRPSGREGLQTAEIHSTPTRA